MKKLFMMKGLPGCGKSTEAFAIIRQTPGAFKRVNKDDLRDMIDGGKWSQDNEKFILKVRDSIVSMALESGKHVIVDDTNLAPKHEAKLREIANKHGADFEVCDLTHVSIETCIERDLKRSRSVGESVIRKMYREYLEPVPPIIENNPLLPSCVICDIDGTAALINGRGPYDSFR